MAATRPPDLLPRELARLRVVVAVPPDEAMREAIRELQRTRAELHHVWPMPARLPADADVLVCSYEERLAERLPWTIGRPSAALVVLLPPGRPVDYRRLRDTAPHAVAARPLPPGALTAALVTGHSAFRYEQRLHQRIDGLDETVKALRSIERAKALLMERRQMSEEEAWRHMRDMAMRLRVPVAKVAATLVDSAPLLK
ncbi:ANTAR domain-containing response regulator [Marinimicrococcus flavescens]|uniref:ANTAR domain-containing protein n=1 Tax=Marinimicrococcus flavescens TaxID=3031815 RepID=A0AAP3XPN0_9PROT|nr:ANTAR domain-containing protein [Marinimicrococcus flavescens]